MNEKTLVIVESPAKASTIGKYLGPDYMVSSSMGHVRDLNPNILSIDIADHFRPHYEELKDKKKIILDLKKLAKKCKTVLLAPDPDREGEAIAFHLKELLSEINSNIFRIFFNEITKSAILNAIQHPVNIDMNKVDSQQMRRILDRLAGYKISPVLQKKIGGPLSAGRVQSVALKIIVEREKEIFAFEPEEFWTITADVMSEVPPSFATKLEKKNNKKLKISNETDCMAIITELEQNTYELSNIERKTKKKEPLPPLITSTLQQEAYKKHGMPVKMTMKIAQELYEGITLDNGEQTGLITYMRTDSFRISNEATAAVREYITHKFNRDNVPEKPNHYGKKGKIQDAHETIRPTVPLHEPETISHCLSEAQRKIYQLIWDRFVSSQMKPAIVEETTFHIQNGVYTFISKGETVRFRGFTEVLKMTGNTEELPLLHPHAHLTIQKVLPKQHFTKPPARYSEASLVKVLEEKGIGRPSTYAKIIDTLGKRDYVSREDKKFVPTFLGIQVSDFLDSHFPDIMNYNFTADLEKQLDAVSFGELIWQEGIAAFYTKLVSDLDVVMNIPKVILDTQKQCPKCGKPLALKYSFRTRGWFVGCTGYPTCTHTEKFTNDGIEKSSETLDRACPKEGCGKPLVKRYSAKTKRYFIGCSAFPECDYMETVIEDLGVCPNCGNRMERKYSQKTRRHFIACSAFPECNYIEKGKHK